MKFEYRKMADRFTKIMEKAGADVRSSEAGTGTIYVTVNQLWVVRFADHGECYCRENISVDPDGCSLEQAVRATGRECGIDVSRSLAAFKSAATRRWNAGADDRAIREQNLREYAESPIFKKRQAFANWKYNNLDVYNEMLSAKWAFQKKWVEKNCADFDTRSKSARRGIKKKSW